MALSSVDADASHAGDEESKEAHALDSSEVGDGVGIQPSFETQLEEITALQTVSSAIELDPAPVGRVLQRITNEHMEVLIKEALCFSGSVGKWNHLHSVYIGLNPQSTLDQNAVKCRVNRLIAKRKAAAITRAPAVNLRTSQHIVVAKKARAASSHPHVSAGTESQSIRSFFQ